jgi:hypothetical protein
MPGESPLPPAQRQILHWRPTAHSLLSVSFGQMMDRARWQQAGAWLLERHAILRAALSDDGQHWLEQDLSAFPTDLWQEPDWSEVAPEELGGKWEQLQKDEESRPFLASEQRLWRWHLLHLPGGHSHFLWTIHPALLEEKEAGALLLEWFSLYENPPAEAGELIPVPPLAAVVASLELQEDEAPARQALRDLYPLLCQPWQRLLSSPAPTENNPPLTHELPSTWIQAHQAWCEELEISHAQGLSLLWAGFSALLHPENQSLTAVPSQLDGLLAPEHRHITARLNPWLPLRATAPPVDPTSYPGWAKTLHQTATALIPSSFTDWPQWMSQASASSGIFPSPSLPCSRVRWREHDLNHSIHTALPRWLGVDAVWKEAPLFPLEVEMHAGRVSQLLVRTNPEERLPSGVGRWILSEFARMASCVHTGSAFSFAESFPANALNAEGFRLIGEPDLVDTLNAALVEHAEQPLLQAGEDTLWGRDLFHYSNQLARYLRKQKNPSEHPVCLCLMRGPWLALTLLTMVRERLSFCLLDPDSTPEDWPSDIPAEDGLLLLDSAVEETWTDFPAKKIVVDAAWDKIGAFPSAELSPRKATGVPTNSFAGQPGETFGESMLAATVRGAVQLLGLRPGDRLLSTAPRATPALLEEVLLSILGGNTLVFQGDGHFATRSDFQDALQQGEITHVVLPAQSWADWVHFLVELRLPLPPSLRQVVVRAGLTGPGVRQAWEQTGFPSGQTAWVYSPWGVLGLGWQWSPDLATAGLPSGTLFSPWSPLGFPASGCGALALDAADRVLPPEFAGRIALELPDTAILDGTPRRRLTELTGAVDVDGCWWSNGPVEMPPGNSALSPDILTLLHTVVAEDPALFDGLFLPGSKPHSVAAWVIPFDSHQLQPGAWVNSLAAVLPPPWQLTAVSCLPRYPVNSCGALDWTQLPPADPWSSAPVAKSRSQSSTEVTQTQPTAVAGSDTPTFVWLRQIPPTSAPTAAAAPTAEISLVLILVDQEERARALAEGVPEDAALLWCQSGSHTFSLPAPAEAAWLQGTLLVLADGAAVWAGLRSASLWPNPEKSPLPPLLIAPALPAESGHGVKEKLQGLWSKWTKSPGHNARREGAVALRTTRWEQAARVLWDGTPPPALLQLFPEAEFYDADLASDLHKASAIRDVLASAPEADETEAPPPSPA